jgi:hypothetical protein
MCSRSFLIGLVSAVAASQNCKFTPFDRFSQSHSGNVEPSKPPLEKPQSNGTNTGGFYVTNVMLP